MKNNLITKIFIAFCFFSSIENAEAKQSTNVNPWGYTGLINMPNAEVNKFGEFSITGSYLFKNSGFIGNAQMGIFDRLELGIVGGVPSAGFSGLAGNLKYQIISPTANNPTSLAAGVNLLGFMADNGLVTGHNLYMVVSHDFNLKLNNSSLYNIFSGHFGFSGNLNGSRMMLGLDIPFTEYFNLNAEYLTKMNNLEDSINFGLKVKPLPFMTLSFTTIGTSTTNGFAKTEYFASVSFHSSLNNPEKSSQNITETKITKDLNDLPEKKNEETLLKQNNDKLIETVEVKQPEKNNSIITGKILSSERSKVFSDVVINLTGIGNNFSLRVKSATDGSFSLKEIPEGDFFLDVFLQGYENYKKKIILKKDDKVEINVEMKKLTGSVSGKVVFSDGKQATGILVSVDNNSVLTDFSGKYAIEGLSKGFKSLDVYQNQQKIKTLKIEIIPDKDLKKEIIIELEKKESKETLKNAIQQDLPKEVKTDDFFKTNPAKNSTENKIIKKEDIKPGEKNSEKKIVELNKKNNSSIIGKIISDKEGLVAARVLIESEKITIMTISGTDGKYLIKSLPAGDYKMTISKSGYSTRIFSIKVPENKSLKHDVNLVLN